MKHDRPFSEGSSVRVLWVISASADPVTTGEISEEIGSARNWIQQVVTRLWRSGLVVRRRRQQPSNGPNPYEYSVSPLEGEDA